MVNKQEKYIMDYADKDTEYYTAQRDDIIQILPKKVDTLLDVGCGQGNFAVAAKEVFDCETWGVEYNPKEAKVASSRLDKVFVGKIEDNMKKIPKNMFDVISFNDVLEHLVDPYELLSKLKVKLSPDGVIVASIPNVRYIRNLAHVLFQKDWEYREEGGILDTTHLRFFTKKSIVRMFEETGYEVEEIKGISQINKAKATIISLASFGGMTDTTYLQFAVRARVKKG